ncbi:hypothetical protein [Rummeliibacillus pycnus]|uniref:hypothetical protein n=1 Tax=Rummeliibacillus pycnus TaxID=101070 RepID=UPI0037C89B91
MKKVLAQISIALFALGMLSACGSSKDDTSAEKENGVKETQTKEGTKTNADKAESKEIKDGPLTKVGQWTKEDGGTKVTLAKIANPNKEINLDPIKLNIKTIKFLERTNIQDSEKEYIKELYNKDISNKLNVIQISYTVENTSDKDITFFAFNKLTTNTKQQIDGMLNLIMNTDPRQYVGKVVTDGTLVVPYFQDSFDDLSLLTILTDNVFDTNNGKNYHAPEKVQIKF